MYGVLTKRLSILAYHRVYPVDDPEFPDRIGVERFDAQMRVLKRFFNVIPMMEAVELIERDRLPPMAAWITFDDGYADNAELALPILEKHGLNATFFISTGFLNGGRMWNDSVIEFVFSCQQDEIDLQAIGLGVYATSGNAEKYTAIEKILTALKHLPFDERREKISRIETLADNALPDNLMMTSEQVKQFDRAGMTIGAHTVNHPIIAKLSHEDAEREIASSKRELEEITGHPIELFAYPNGVPEMDYRYEHVTLLKDLGFKAAVSTAWGAAQKGADLFQLPRFTPWDKASSKFALRLFHNRFRTSYSQAA